MLGEMSVEFLTRLFNKIFKSQGMPKKYGRSVLVPNCKSKRDLQSCSYFRGIKLISHIWKNSVLKSCDTVCIL